jgi:hypothetical protein
MVLSEQIPTIRRQIEAHLIARALRDDECRRLLIADPKSALEAEIDRLQLNIKLPSDLKVRVLEESPDTIYLVLPPDLTAPGKTPEDFFLEAVRSLNLNGN